MITRAVWRSPSLLWVRAEDEAGGVELCRSFGARVTAAPSPKAALLMLGRDPDAVDALVVRASDPVALRPLERDVRRVRPSLALVAVAASAGLAPWLVASVMTRVRVAIRARKAAIELRSAALLAQLAAGLHGDASSLRSVMTEVHAHDPPSAERLGLLAPQVRATLGWVDGSEAFLDVVLAPRVVERVALRFDAIGGLSGVRVRGVVRSPVAWSAA